MQTELAVFELQSAASRARHEKDVRAAERQLAHKVSAVERWHDHVGGALIATRYVQSIDREYEELRGKLLATLSDDSVGHYYYAGERYEVWTKKEVDDLVTAFHRKELGVMEQKDLSNLLALQIRPWRGQGKYDVIVTGAPKFCALRKVVDH